MSSELLLPTLWWQAAANEKRYQPLLINEQVKLSNASLSRVTKVGLQEVEYSTSDF